MKPLRPNTLQIFHRLMKFFPSLTALIVSLNTEACTRQNPLRAYKESGGKFHDMLHQDNSFLFRGGRGRGQVPFWSHSTLTRIFRLIIPAESAFSLCKLETTDPFFLHLP